MNPQVATAHRIHRHRRAKDCTEKADANSPGWSEKAYAFLDRYSLTHKSFLIEEVRHASRGKVPDSHDPRAWGGVVKRARNDKVIRPTGRFSVFTGNAQPKILWERA